MRTDVQERKALIELAGAVKNFGERWIDFWARDNRMRQAAFKESIGGLIAASAKFIETWDRNPR